jgi:hypothetical protein
MTTRADPFVTPVVGALSVRSQYDEGQRVGT